MKFLKIFRKNKKIQNLDFFTVTANFDMSQYGDIECESFRQLDNANAFGKKMKEKFLSEIPNRKLDEEETLEELEHYYFKGQCIDGENYVTISVQLTNFKDSLFLNEQGGQS